MPRVLVDVAAGGGFGPPQWLALLGAALLSVCAVVFLCGSSGAKGGESGKAPAPEREQEMADRSAAAASKTRMSLVAAPTPEIASRSDAAALTSGGGDPERGRRCCRCAGWPECGSCGGPCYSGFGAEGGDCCCCDGCDCGGCDCSGVDCGGCLDCIGGCDCSGVDCGGCVDCIGGCCGACLMLLAACPA